MLLIDILLWWIDIGVVCILSKNEEKNVIILGFWG